MNKHRFWNWVRDADSGSRALYILGAIAEDPWLEDDVTPKAFREELFADTGDVTLYIHSPGGDVFAASQIYTMLMDYPGNVTVKIEGLAASAASVIAMAGATVLMAPTAMLMLHDPSTIAIGNAEEMQRAIEMLAAVKESIITAYEIKTGLSRAKLSKLMAAESWLYAGDAIKLGFADGMIEGAVTCGGAAAFGAATENQIFSRAAVTNSLLDKIRPPAKKEPGIPVRSLEQRLSLILH